MSLFICPVCGQPLHSTDRSYLCDNRHCFDRAGNGYVNLLLANHMNSHAPGDDKAMVNARAEFLQKGYYAPLREALQGICLRCAPEKLLDLGCGEGYYTQGVVEVLRSAYPKVQAAGVDISKSAVKLAAKRCGDAEFAVASVFHLPVADRSVDLLLNCFSPLCLPEILRVLRPGGTFVYVVPGPAHLWGLKAAVYAQPYANERKETPYEGLTYREIIPVEGSIRLACNGDIQNVFRMTPYFWKTSKEDQDKLAALATLETPIAFDLHIYTRI